MHISDIFAVVAVVAAVGVDVVLMLVVFPVCLSFLTKGRNMCINGRLVQCSVMLLKTNLFLYLSLPDVPKLLVFRGR